MKNFLIKRNRKIRAVVKASSLYNAVYKFIKNCDVEVRDYSEFADTKAKFYIGSEYWEAIENKSEIKIIN